MLLIYQLYIDSILWCCNSKLDEKNQQLEQATDESRQNQKEYEETRRQIEEDADREILDIKNKYERRLRDEKEANSRLKGETGILTKKVSVSLCLWMYEVNDNNNRNNW